MPKNGATEEVTKEETVEVSKDKLDAILKRQDEQDKEIEILREAASRGRLEEADNKRKEKELPKVHLKVYNEKVVVGWKSSAAKIIFSQGTNQPIGEVLQAVYKFIDDTETEPIDQKLVNDSNERVFARIVEDRGIKAVIKFEDPALPQEYEIDKSFLNPQ
jgi:hypothetical protein